MLDMIKPAQSPLIVAVSGGVDSVSLLHMLVQKNEHMIVAHVNHGIRADSDDDEIFVRELAAAYELPFFTMQLGLGSLASEEIAREARYAWLEKLAKDQGSTTIVTAHHQDDVIETMIINLIRGTSWRGLASLRSTNSRLRPLLAMSKAEVVGYAIKQKLIWREDSTNETLHYLRNRIRHLIVPRLTVHQRRKLVDLYDAQRSLRDQIQSEGCQLVDTITLGHAIERHTLVMVEPDVAIEMLKIWLAETLETSRMSDLLLFAKVARPGDRWSLDTSRYVVADKTRLIVLRPSD